jgi:Sec-independent protein secretion pathway component TatC
MGTWLTFEGTALSTEMILWQHLDELRARALRILICITAITFFSITFGFKPFEFNGFVLYLPYPDLFHNFSIQITAFMQAPLLPEVSN